MSWGSHRDSINNSRVGISNQYLTFCLSAYGFWKEYYLLCRLTPILSLSFINYKMDGAIFFFSNILSVSYPSINLLFPLLLQPSPFAFETSSPLCLNSPFISPVFYYAPSSKTEVLNPWVMGPQGTEWPFAGGCLRPSAYQIFTSWFMTVAKLQFWSKNENNFIVCRGHHNMRNWTKGSQH